MSDAIQAHDLEKLVRMLKEDPSRVHQRETNEETPLHRAVWEGQEEMASLLIDAGADVNSLELNDENTPLHYAAQAERPATVAELLIRKGADIEKPNRAKETPLFVAAMRNQDVAKVLIDHGAFIDLNSAVLLGDTNRVRVLLEDDPQLLRVGFPDLLLDTALQRCSKDIVELLLAHGVDPNKGAPPVFTAVAKILNDPSCNEEILLLLLEHGAAINRKCEGVSILSFVRKFQSKNKRKVVAILKRYGAK
jgi:ankyrin repeat protein